MVKLIIEDDEGKTTIVPLIRDEITIGRKEGNTIRLTERNVSRRHAKLVKQNGQVFLEDLGSYNGIRVNGNRISGKINLKEGDRVQIGDYLLALKMEAHGAAQKADPFEEMKTLPLERAPTPEPSAESYIAELKNAPIPASQAPLEAQPTRQIRADLVEGRPTEQPARLVVISENLAGTEFPLDQPSIVVGRIKENDIVLEHRSVSKHHAKIRKEGQSYFIYDLQSQNGVIVNSDKYDQVQLRKGDLIDLGHVRLRFVAPGEDFVFARDVAETSSSSRKMLYIVGAGLVAAVLLIIIIFKIPGSGSKNKSQKSPEEKATPSSRDGMVEQPRVVPLDRSRINAAIAARDWDKALDEANSFLKLHPDDSQTKGLKDKAARERNNQKEYQKFDRACQSSNLATALTIGSDFPKNSVYYNDVKRRMPPLLQSYADTQYTKAVAMARAKQCQELKALVKEVSSILPRDRRFRSLSDRCGRKFVEAREPRTREPREARTREPSEPRPPASDGKALANAAREALLAGNCGKAIKLGRKAYRSNPSATVASTVGVCACRIKSRSAAKWAYNRTSGSRRNAIVQLCKARGIELP